MIAKNAATDAERLHHEAEVDALMANRPFVDIATRRQSREINDVIAALLGARRRAA